MIFKSVTDPDPLFIWPASVGFKIWHLSYIYFIVCYALELRHCINEVDQLEVRGQDSVLCGKLALNLSKSLEMLCYSVKELN